MMCAFCTSSVSSACVTCDAPMCKYHRRGGKDGECRECWRERALCEDCGGHNSTETPLCLDCGAKPQYQTELHTLPPCPTCGKYEERVRACGGCERQLCHACTRECCSSQYCDIHFCDRCARHELTVCQACDRMRRQFAEENNLYDEEDLCCFRPPAKLLCRRCYSDHRFMCYSFDDYLCGGITPPPRYLSSSDSDDDDADPAPWPPFVDDDEDDITSECSSAA